MILIVAVPEVSSLEEYVARGKVQVERPVKCYNQACGRSNGFWRHTGYKRMVREGELSIELTIERFLCKHCGLVISCLLDFLVPYVVFTASLIGRIVKAYASKPVSYRSLSGDNGTLNSAEGEVGGPRPSHSQVFRWVGRIAKQAEVLLTHLQRLVVQVYGVLGAGAQEKYVCPNSWKVRDSGKETELDQSLELLAYCGKFDVFGAPLIWVYRYFLQSGAFQRAIFSGRSMKLSAQQRVRHGH